MDLTSLKTIKNLLKSHGVRPLKRLGQNFLIDKGTIMKFIEAAELKSEDAVMEIGPGLGVLTQELAKRAKKVIAVEKDPEMIKILKETMKGYKNVEVILGDIRKYDFQKTPQNFKVVGNLPFYLTAPIIRRFLERLEARPLTMVFVVQKEVGQRICAKPPDMNLLAVSVQFYAEPKIIAYISKESFWPSPEVDAAIVKIVPKTQNIQRTVLCVFFKIVKAGFSQPRKQLINNLSNGLNMEKQKTERWLLENSIEPSRRAETLNMENWINLTKGYKME